MCPAIKQFLAEINFPFLACQCWPQEKAAGKVIRRCCSSLPEFPSHLSARCELKSGTVRKSLPQAKREDGGMCYFPAMRAWRCSSVLFSRSLCLMLRNFILSSECRHWIQALCSVVDTLLGAKMKQNPRCGTLVGVKWNLDVNITTLHLHKLLGCMLGFNLAWWLY